MIDKKIITILLLVKKFAYESIWHIVKAGLEPQRKLFNIDDNSGLPFFIYFFSHNYRLANKISASL